MRLAFSRSGKKEQVMNRVRMGTCVLSALVLACGAGGAAAHSSHDIVAVTESRVQVKGEVLALDEAVFWPGGTLSGRVPDSALCDTPLGACTTFKLNIAHGGARLRVGLDTPERSNTFVVEVLDGSGAEVGSAATSNQFNTEALILAPVGGDYTIRVRPENVPQGSFRMRAKLESTLPEDLPRSAGRVPLLPNLRTVPPLEFGFIAPANPLNGLYPPDTVNPPLDVAGVHPLSCTADEMAPPELGGGGAVKCLRFTSGPINLGPGIYDMRFEMLADFIAGQAQLAPEEALSRIVIGPMDQAVHYSDGSIEFVPAGTYSFHPVHGHFHDDYVLTFRLYAVSDAAEGAMQQVGVGTKSGFCPADQLWGDWYSFDQGYAQPGGDSALGNCMSPVNGVLGLSIGWGDVYRWQRPGMYVEFGGQGNGLYVVQARVDEQNVVMETDETDNVSYAYVQIENDAVQLIERGWGESPWDRRKTVFRGSGPAEQEPVLQGPPADGAADKSNVGRFGGALGLAPLLWLLGLLRRGRNGRYRLDRVD
jgi:hypothetical protein